MRGSGASRDYSRATISIMKGTKTEVSPGVWRLRVYVGRRPNGAPIQVTKTVRAPIAKQGAGVRIADKELAVMVAKASRGKLTTGTDTLRQIIEDYFVRCDLEGRSPTTMREYRRIAETVVYPAIGALPVSKLTHRRLNDLYGSLVAKGNKPTTVRRVHALINAALNHAEKTGGVEHNIARRASPPRVRPAQVEAPSPEQVRDIIKAAEEEDPAMATLLLLAALTGARRGELCGLRWSDVDWKGSTLAISRSIYQTSDGGWGEKGTKTHAVRRIGLDPVAVEALRRHQARAEAMADEAGVDLADDGFVFSFSPAGSEPLLPDLVTRRAAKLAKAGGVETHLHTLRHFAATQGIAAGFDAVTVSQRLGHADPSITLKVYSHAIEQRDRDLADSLGATLALGQGTK
jgi:integrase